MSAVGTVTVTWALALLFPGFGSTSFAQALTLTVNIPGAVGVAWKEI
jgi:hypothetical protein